MTWPSDFQYMRPRVVLFEKRTIKKNNGKKEAYQQLDSTQERKITKTTALCFVYQ